MRLYIKLLTGKTVTVYADTVEQVLSQIQTMESVSNDKFCLICDGKIMNDDSFNDKSLKEDSLLILGIKMLL
jgi:hypothetical protein